MISNNLKNFYSYKKDQIKEEIDFLDLSDELKKGLLKTNETLYNYAIKLNTNSINSRISFYYLFKNLRYGERSKIINTIKLMFKYYDLCDGKTKKVDVSENNPYPELDSIEEYSFWEFDFTEYCRASFFDEFTSDLKKVCRDLIKCIFIFGDDKLYDDSQIEIAKENNPYKKYKYQFDYIFSFEDKESVYKDLKKNLTKNGFECDFTSSDILNINQYRDNEIFIENALIKNNISKDNNKLSFKDLNYETNEIKNIKLKDMIGLKNVKKQMEDLKNLLNFYKDINKTNNAYLNVIFKGNPGTGKTTVARNYADLLYSLGYIKNNNLVEIVPTDLMGEYVGQTKETTREILRKAKGGVLFIDEAYNLNTAKEYSGGTYMREAVVELLKYMEDKNNVVIYAGYKLEMEELLNINPGFKSRIGTIIEFEDYTTKELIDIFKYNARKYDLKYTKGFEKKLSKKIERDKTKKNFGNARYIENLLNKILYVHASNVYKMKNDLYLLTEDDLDIKEELNSNFGFAIKND